MERQLNYIRLKERRTDLKKNSPENIFAFMGGNKCCPATGGNIISILVTQSGQRTTACFTESSSGVTASPLRPHQGPVY